MYEFPPEHIYQLKAVINADMPHKPAAMPIHTPEGWFVRYGNSIYATVEDWATRKEQPR